MNQKLQIVLKYLLSNIKNRRKPKLLTRDAISIQLCKHTTAMVLKGFKLIPHW